MKERQKVQYTVRDVPEAIDVRVRETADLEGISLNQAVVQALQRGLGLADEPVRYRSLRGMVRATDKPDRKGWDEALGAMDKVHPEDWK